MTPHPAVCPTLAEGPSYALESLCRWIPRSAHLAGVGLLMAFLSTLRGSVPAPGLSRNMAEGDTLISVDYEIFGKVQGVFFRKYTQAESKKLGLVGWVQNTDQGTVQGQLQGPISKVRHMQEWLETKGSPKSHIDRANFSNEKVILKLDYSDFQIVK
ncbi:acylphosphatase-1 isoform 6-T7 [Molossus nigricans]|uniref:Acylphosphatase n=2 Tax=Molossus molossus TaxID=27622 RepID=A0A7J8JPU1_MOLMO|nr:acylphosphatase-1 isoform X1 [Molossus molossus]KAF6498788.1 acylphosphatase 1 [Molossus molossus]